MFLRNLLNKINSLVNKEDLKSIFINNFREIVAIVVSIWIIVMIIILFGIMGSKKIAPENNKTLESSNREKALEKKVNDELLLNSDDFILTDSVKYDMTNDFVDMMPKKKFEMPGKDVVRGEYDKLQNKDINESLKFDFEKRKSFNNN